MLEGRSDINTGHRGFSNPIFYCNMTSNKSCAVLSNLSVIYCLHLLRINITVIAALTGSVTVNKSSALELQTAGGSQTDVPGSLSHGSEWKPLKTESLSSQSDHLTPCLMCQSQQLREGEQDGRPFLPGAQRGARCCHRHLTPHLSDLPP